MNSEIYHCVFTHAKEDGEGSGGRFARVEREATEILPDAAVKELQALLRKLTPEGNKPAFAMRRFSGGREKFACVAVSYDGFEDAAGREGVLTHARVVQLEKDSTWLDPYPLVALAEQLDIEAVKRRDAVDRLQAYLDAIADEDVVTVRALSRQELKTLPRELLQDVVTGALAGIADSRGRRRVHAPHGPVAQIARAWASLPVGLQRKGSWAYRANDGVPVQFLFTTDARDVNVDGPSLVVKECAARYTRLVYDSSYDLSQYVKNEELDLGGFSQDVQRMAATVAATGATGSPPVEKKMSAKKNQKSEPVDDLTAELNRQYDRMHDSLIEYIDLRLKAYEAGRPVKGAAHAPQWKTWLQRYGIAIGAVAGLLLAAAVVYAMGWIPARTRERVIPPAQAAVVNDEEPPAEPPVDTPAPQSDPRFRALVDDASASGKWKEAFLTATEQQPDVIASMLTNASERVDAKTRSAILDLRDRLTGKGKKLTSADRESLRRYLLQYVGAVETGAVTIDNDLSDLTPVLVRSLKRTTNARSASDSAQDFDLQSEIILRWLEANPS
jgi:hypothetical protein